MLVHVRPGWEEMHGYLAGLDRGARRGARARRVAVRGVRVHDVRAFVRAGDVASAGPARRADRGEGPGAQGGEREAGSGAQDAGQGGGPVGRRQISVCRAGRPHRRLGTARATAHPGGGAVHAVRHRHRAGPARRGPGRGGRAGRRAAHAGQDAHGPVHDLRAVRAVPRGASERAVRAARPGAHPGGAYRRASRSRKSRASRRSRASSRAGSLPHVPAAAARRRADAPASDARARQGGGARGGADGRRRALRRGRGVEAQRHARRDRRAARRGRGEDAGQRPSAKAPAPTRRATPPRTPRAPPARTTARAEKAKAAAAAAIKLAAEEKARERAERKRETPPNAL